MLFYFALIGIALVVWTIIAAFVPTAAVVNVSVFGILTFILVIIGIRRGYDRGRKKEIYFGIALIALYSLRGFIRGIIMGIYNFIFGLVVTQLNNRGVTTIDVERSKWNLDQTGNTLFEIIIFIAGSITAYVLTSGMDTKVYKDIFGAILGGFSVALFLTYTFMLLRPYLGPVYSTNLLQGASFRLPAIQLPGVQVQQQSSNRSPLEGWETWLPVLVLILVTSYFLFFVKPFTKTSAAAPARNRTDTATIVGVALLLAFLWVFAVRPPS